MANDTNAGDLDVEFVPEKGLQDRFDAANAADDAEARRRGTTQVVKDEAGKLTAQAGDRLRAFADDGKSRATGALDELAKTIEDAATQIEDKFGGAAGGYARSASGAVTNFAETLRGKNVDDLVDDAREFVRKSPGVAIGAATLAGFVLARVVWSGIDANKGA